MVSCRIILQKKKKKSAKFFKRNIFVDINPVHERNCIIYGKLDRQNTSTVVFPHIFAFSHVTLS